MKYITVVLLLSILLFDVVIGGIQETKEKRSVGPPFGPKSDSNRVRRSVPHQGLIDPADLGMRLKSRRSDPFRRAPRMKRFRRMAEDPEMFKRETMDVGKHIRVKKDSKA